MPKFNTAAETVEIFNYEDEKLNSLRHANVTYQNVE
jgi:hypothetical protein